MTSLVPGSLFHSPGLNRKSTPAPPTATPKDIDAKHSRAPYNGRPWPRDSPVAQVYDISNTSTKLILYNNSRARVKSRSAEGYTHLRGQKRADKALRKPSPERHETPELPRVNKEKHQKCTVSETPRYKPAKPVNMHWRNTPVLYENGSSVNPKYHAPCMVSGDPNELHWRRPRRRPRSTISLPESLYSRGSTLDNNLNKGEKRYLWSIARIYSVENLKRLKQHQYEQLLIQERRKGTYTKSEFKKYNDYLNSPRKTATGTDTPRRRATSAPPAAERGQSKSVLSKRRQQSSKPDQAHYPRPLKPVSKSKSSSRQSLSSTHSKQSSKSSDSSSTKTSKKEKTLSETKSSEEQKQQVEDDIDSRDKETKNEMENEKTKEDGEEEEKSVKADGKEETGNKDDGEREERPSVEEEDQPEPIKKEPLALLRQMDRDMEGDDDVRTTEEDRSNSLTTSDASPKDESDARKDEKAEHKFADSDRDDSEQLPKGNDDVGTSESDKKQESDYTEDFSKSESQDRTESTAKNSATEDDKSQAKDGKDVTETEESSQLVSDQSEPHSREGYDRPKSRIGVRNREEPVNSDDDYDTDFDTDSSSSSSGSEDEDEEYLEAEVVKKQENYKKIEKPKDKTEVERAKDEETTHDGNEQYVAYSDHRQGEEEIREPSPTEKYVPVDEKRKLQENQDDEQQDIMSNQEKDSRGDNSAIQRRDSIEEGREDRVTDVDKIEY